MQRLKTYFILLSAFFYANTIVSAQSLSFIPGNTSNTRFNSNDIFENEIVRPALSIRGFDAQNRWQGTPAINFRYGLSKPIKSFPKS